MRRFAGSSPEAVNVSTDEDLEIEPLRIEGSCERNHVDMYQF